MFKSVSRGTAPRADEVTVTKQDLVGQVVVFQVAEFIPDASTMHGIQAQADVDLLVVTGPLAGTEVQGWRCWGNLAKQMDAQEGAEPTVARVVAGPDRNGTPSWYGIDISVTDAEFEAAQAAIGGGKAAKSSAKSGDSRVPF